MLKLCNGRSETNVECDDGAARRHNYQLCTLMAIDENGEGQPIQQSLLERSADWHMSRALEHMLRVNPGAADKVQVIMVDKDLNEIRTLRAYFPRARILICVFHVLKYLKHASRKREYGKISTDDHDSVDTLVHNMVYAQSETAYENERRALQWLCKSVGFIPFFDYIEKNWHTCTDMWVAYKRAKLPHFRVHTNNHLEAWFGKFKECLKSTVSLAETVKQLVGYDRRLTNEYQYKRNRIGVNTNANYDEEMSEVLLFTNHFVAGSIEQQYAMAVDKVDVFKYDVDASGERVTVKGEQKSHVVDLRSWHCTCSFANAMKLPCQHAMAYRRWRNPDGICIPKIRIDARYVRSFTLDPC
jgi:hypothetical protein